MEVQRWWMSHWLNATNMLNRNSENSGCRLWCMVSSSTCSWTLALFRYTIRTHDTKIIQAPSDTSDDMEIHVHIFTRKSMRALQCCNIRNPSDFWINIVFACLDYIISHQWHVFHRLRSTNCDYWLAIYHKPWCIYAFERVIHPSWWILVLESAFFRNYTIVASANNPPYQSYHVLC